MLEKLFGGIYKQIRKVKGNFEISGK